MTGRIFINYRRDDSAEAAQALYTQLGLHFSIANLFMDTNSIEPGSAWPERIRAALEASDAVICLIGKNWLGAHDEYRRRRLDLESDWVRQEIERALARGVHIYAVLLGDAERPPPEALPASLAGFAERQSWRLARESWMSDLRALVLQLEKDGVIEDHHSMRDHPAYPDPAKVKLSALNEEELTAALATLDEWKPWSERILREYPYERRELRRTISFESFSSAMRFMSEATEIFTRLDHHPRWGNQWMLVDIRLTTWDAGNKITKFDVETAREIDSLVERFGAQGLLAD